ncbi:MAG: oxidoreductase family protein [Moraxellaceae bacterium]|jgi:choline dehydrogenase-like flavoprotein|nr:oxidoreductase family protein [Moraxellaceae bacterium]
MIYKEMPQEGLPVTRAADISSKELRLDADVIVVGSGSGGAIAAYELARAGRKVIILEAGSYIPSADFKEDLADSMQRMFQDYGLQTNATGDLILLQGAMVGGSSVVDGTICERMPKEVLEKWQKENGLENLTQEDMNAHYDKIEKRLSVHPNEAYEINDNANIVISGCEGMGWSWKPVSRNTRQCALTGHCIAGCASDRKQSAMVTHLPWAIAHGAEIYTNARVDFVNIRNGRASGVEGRIIDPDTKQEVSRFYADAQLVVLAAGAVQTPLILQKSGIGGQSGMVGRNLSVHPSVTVLGKFPEPIYGWRGALTGVKVDQFNNEENGHILMTSGLAAPMQLISQGELGEGEAHVTFMQNYKHYAALNVFVHDHGQGYVHWDGDVDTGEKRVDWNLSRDEFLHFREALKHAGRIMFAAGAEKVHLPAYNLAAASNVFELDKSVDQIEFGAIGFYTLRMLAYEPQGTCRMGRDPFTSVVNPWGECHEVKGLFVTDASILPSETTTWAHLTVCALSSYIVDNIVLKSPSYFWS